MDLATNHSTYLRDLATAPSQQGSSASALLGSGTATSSYHRSMLLAGDSERDAHQDRSFTRYDKESAPTAAKLYDKYGLDRLSSSSAWLADSSTGKTNFSYDQAASKERANTTSSSALVDDNRYTRPPVYTTSSSALEFSSDSSPFKRCNTRTATTATIDKGSSGIAGLSGSLRLVDLDPYSSPIRHEPHSSSGMTATIDKYIPSYRDHSSYQPATSRSQQIEFAFDGMSTNRSLGISKITSSSAQMGPDRSINIGPSTSSMGNYPRENLTSSIGGAALPSAAESRVQSSLGLNVLQQLFDDVRQIEDTVDSIEIPARGRCKVFMAKYGYDPYKQSPNENPDNELAFNAGDYILVFDDIDEDGYFIGELMDGRRGYVPSNWLDRLTGEDLFEFQATTLFKNAKDDESGSTSYPPEFYDSIVNDTLQHSNFQHVLAPEDYRRMNDYVDLDDVDEVDDECLSDYERAEAEQMRKAVPPPQKLLLERQLNKCILISWLHPDAVRGTIVSYQVYVDGVLKSTVPSGDRTKALLEGVDSTIPHRISVRAIDLNGRHSNDAGCTIVIGQKVPFAPSCVKASHITSDSALISWLPCNSNFHHVVAVNSVEVQTVRPGVYKHLINGLSANTIYRVWVRAKPGKILSIDEKNPKKLESLTTYVDFKTMPKSLPDPPVNVQVEAGPQRHTLLVTWLPLTLNDYGSSNGCPVTGYAVFAGHKKLADIDSPTGDHALLDVSDLESLHKKFVTVRTKSGENLSQDSMSCQIPDEYLKFAGPKLNENSHSHHQASSNRHKNYPAKDSHGRPIPNINYGHHSPMRFMGRHSSTEQRNIGSHLASPRGQPSYKTSMVRGRHMARSLQNLESDLDSRRSSIPAIEITRDPNRSDSMNYTESYSEEEFENSMRFRGAKGNRLNPRYRAKRYHSMDGAPNMPGRYHSTGARTRGQTSFERDVRYFVALFDYDPSTMSPNPNATVEELAFKEGSIIKIIGDKGPDGFYRGELDGHVGFVPCNVVSEIMDQNVLYSIHEKNLLKRQQHALNQQQQMMQINMQPGFINNPQQQPSRPQTQAEFELHQHVQQQQQQVQQQQQQQQQAAGVKRMIALYDYNPQENSPNVDTESEIPFKVGDIIYVYGKMDTDGFYIGEVERTKQKGLVPSNFLKEDPFSSNSNQTFADQSQNQIRANQPGNLMAQQQAMNMNQFTGPSGQTQQLGVGGMSDQTIGYGSQSQQQPMGMMNNQQVRVSGLDGGRPPMMPIQGQQNINRPNTLSLGSSYNPQMGSTLNEWSNSTRQQLPGLNQMHDPQYNQLLQQQQQQPNQQQTQQPMNQQPQQGGVLSNLLSSGKQIINAATPRGPNQPNQFPSINQIGTSGMGPVGMGVSSGSGGMMDTIVNNPGMNRSNIQGINQMSGPLQQQQPMQQHTNQIGFSRGQMNHGGDDQSGNILNTVKNMFKL